MEDKWYKLDNAAKIYPAIRDAGWAPVFRVDAVLKEEVNRDLLQEALIMTYTRFPTFFVCMSKGLFWYYFEPNEIEPVVREEDAYPTSPFSMEKDKGYLFRVLYYKRRISLEIFHSITDGSGAIIFLKTLIYNYLCLQNDRELVNNTLELEKYGILYYKDKPSSEEAEDAFQYFASDKENLNLKENTAFTIPGTRIRKNTLKVLHILLGVKELLNIARKYDTTITEFLTSVFIQAIIEARIYNTAEKKPIKISVPINLRKSFPSKTLRNFSTYINVEVFPIKDDKIITFEEICSIVRKQIREVNDIEILRKKFSGNVHAEKNIIMRIAPLFLKNIVLKTSYSLYGDRIMTSTLSNLGKVMLPDTMAEKIDRFDFLIGAPKRNVYNCAVISFKNTISFSFTSVISENIVPKKFVDFLTHQGLEVKLEANY